MTGFDTVIIVDWSARSAPSPEKPAADAIWIACAPVGGGDTDVSYHRTRAAALDVLTGTIEAERSADRRVLVGFDFPFGYPAGFAAALTGTDDPLALWSALDEMIEDDAGNANNRWAVAEALNRRFPGTGPFWGCPASRASADLPAKGAVRQGHGMPERREIEQRIPRAQTCWKLYTTGSVGSQALLGIPRLQALRRRFGADLSVSPFQPPETPIVLAEIYPSLLDAAVRDRQEAGEIKDAAQVRVLAEAISALPPDALDRMLREGNRQEGWILGYGHEAALVAALGSGLQPPPLRDDCFALPRGVEWTPVDTALTHLETMLHPVTRVETLAAATASGRVLAADAIARTSHPPAANSAVDGYGFAHAGFAGAPLPLTPGRAAAGAPFDGTVPQGQALRILTGAVLPPGVDTVVLEEDVTTDGAAVAFRGPLKPGANTRRAGEDVTAGDLVLPAGRRLGAPDLALLAATGVATVSAHRRLRVAVLSTGDEVTDEPPRPGQISDSNRPMMMSLLRRWGHEVIDLGISPDSPDDISRRLDRGAGEADAIFTSGGASAGDEDHVSRLLTRAGSHALWRIALKPGRPLALGLWQGIPVFGLPGNPVAAFVCSLIFGRPALQILSGETPAPPLSFDVPAAFAKTKKPGRREYLRARLRDGTAEVFPSEGSGRVSGLSWAEGLVELPDGAATITPGTPVRYLPFAGFGL